MNAQRQNEPARNLGAMARLALRAYPPSFRDRYGGEIAGLAEDIADRRGVAIDLWRNALFAWLRPSFVGADRRRQRLQATVSTVWIAWCAAFLIAPAMTRALTDPPEPGVGRAVRDLLNAATVLFAVGWVLVVLGAAPLLLRLVLPAFRRRDWRALRPLVPALAMGAFECAVVLVLVTGRGPYTSGVSPAWTAVAVTWIAGFMLFVVSLGIGPALSLRRLADDRARLTLPAGLAVLLAFVMTSMTAASVVAAIWAGTPQIFSAEPPAYAALTVAALASLSALVSAVRGAPELRKVLR